MTLNENKILEGLQDAAVAKSQISDIKRDLKESFFDLKHSIKNDITAVATGAAKDIVQANNSLIKELEILMMKMIAENNDKNLKPLREDVTDLKSDRKAVKWVAGLISTFTISAWALFREIFK